MAEDKVGRLVSASDRDPKMSGEEVGVEQALRHLTNPLIPPPLFTWRAWRSWRFVLPAAVCAIIVVLLDGEFILQFVMSLCILSTKADGVRPSPWTKALALPYLPRQPSPTRPRLTRCEANLLSG